MRLGQHADHAEAKVAERGRQHPGLGDPGERPGAATEDQAVDAQDRVDADLGHDHEQAATGGDAAA